MTGLELPCVTVSGTPADMGLAAGESLRDLIAGMITNRLDVVSGYLSERGIQDVLQGYRAAGAACLSELKDWDPRGYEELAATARGANVPLLDLYSTANMTDIRDVTTYGGFDTAADEGCTAFMGAAVEQHPLVIGQTWDLNTGDMSFVVGVHRLPDDGPETWSVTVAGAPTLIGMNEHGLWVGTTNINVQGARTGVGYLDIQHRAIREIDHHGAVRVATEAPRAAAHTYWYADPSGGLELECSSTRVVQRPLNSETLVQTNHCLDETHANREAEPPKPSSLARLARARELLGEGPVTVEAARAMMSDRSDGVLSINRRLEDNEPTTTNACMIGVPATRTFEACRGSADRGAWVTLVFDRSG